MNNFSQKFIIISLAIFSGFLILVNSVQAQNDLVVEFERTPLFNEANFLPGQGVTGWIKVTNNSGQTQRIAIEAINVNDPDKLGDVLNLKIKEGAATLYNNDLSKFFAAGEIYLSDLAGSGGQTQYDLTVSFYSGSGNIFQGKNSFFDLLVGFQGEEGDLLPGAGGGAGGFLPSGLTIQSGSITATSTQITAIITWLTSYKSTSQVVYGTVSGVFDLTKANYGYPNAVPVPEDSTKVVAHSVTITGLTPNTTYYYRTISHASPPTIGREYSFTTLAASQNVEIEIEEWKTVLPIASAKKTGLVVGPTGEGFKEIFQEDLSKEGKKEVGTDKERIFQTGFFNNLLATMAVLLQNDYSVYLLIVLLGLIILAILVLLYLRFRRQGE